MYKIKHYFPLQECFAFFFFSIFGFRLFNTLAGIRHDIQDHMKGCIITRSII